MILQALRMVKRVVSVEPITSGTDVAVATARVRREVRDKFWEFYQGLSL